MCVVLKNGDKQKKEKRSSECRQRFVSAYLYMNNVRFSFAPCLVKSRTGPNKAHTGFLRPEPRRSLVVTLLSRLMDSFNERGARIGLLRLTTRSETL